MVTQTEEGSERVAADPFAEVTWISLDSEETGTKIAASSPATATTPTTRITIHQRRPFGRRASAVGEAGPSMPWVLSHPI
jgi:hypothetical protein